MRTGFISTNIGLFLAFILLMSVFPAFRSADANTTSILTARSSFLGYTGENQFGDGITILGDVDGDGYDDMAMACPYSNQSGSYSGIVWVMFGSSSATWGQNESVATRADVTFTSAASQLFGYHLNAGDVNGDGLADMVVSAMYADTVGHTHCGKVYIILGSNTRWTSGNANIKADCIITGDLDGQYIGKALDASGDVDGDGCDDIIIGAPDSNSTCGMSFLFLGRHTWPSALSAATGCNGSFRGTAAGDRSGTGVAIIGDVNGDGLDEFVIGAPSRLSSRGTLYIFFGSEETSRWTKNMLVSSANTSFTPASTSYCGYRASWIGDINGDGYDDIAATAYYYSSFTTSNGRVFLFMGHGGSWPHTLTEIDANASLDGMKNYDFLGLGIGRAGDLDGDGIDDLALAAPYQDSGTIDKGVLYLVMGRSTGWTTGMTIAGNSSRIFVGENTGDELGSSIAGGGDMDRDGRVDLLVSSPCYDIPGSDRDGKAYLLYPFPNHPPTLVSQIKTYSDPAYTVENDRFNIGDTVYIELIGSDANATTTDNARVDVGLEGSRADSIRTLLRETAPSGTGSYKGQIRITNMTHASHGWIRGCYGGKVNIVSGDTPTIKKSITILDKVNILNLTLTGSIGKGNVMYAEGEPATVHVSLSSTGPIGDLTNITIGLDEAHFTYVPQTDTFTQTTGGSEFRLAAGSSMNINLDGNMVLDINVVPLWTFPDGLFHNMSVSASGPTLEPGYLHLTDAFRVERYLVAMGQFNVTGARSGWIEENGWAGTTEQLNWTGVKIIYKGTEAEGGRSPTPSSFGATLWEEDSVHWVGSIVNGGNMSFVTTTGSTTARALHYTLNLTNLPPECDEVSRSFTLNVDGGLPMFSHLNGPAGWSNITQQTVSTWIEDNENGLIDTDSVAYSICPQGGDWGSWIPISPTSHPTYYTIKLTTDFGEGTDQVRFRCSDHLNPVYNISGSLNVRVDLTPVTFSDPGPDEPCTNTTPTASILVTDALSGVKTSTIQYSVMSGSGEWIWEQPDRITYDDTLGGWRAGADLTLGPGANYIRWQAYDNASNPGTSEIYTITTPLEPEIFLPTIGLSGPGDEATDVSPRSTLSWTLTNPEHFASGVVTYNLFLGTDMDAVSGHSLEVMVLNGSTSTEYRPPLDLTPGATYYWTVVPYNGSMAGSCVSDVFSFTVISGPAPVHGVSLRFEAGFDPHISTGTGSSFTFNITVHNDGNIRDTFLLAASGNLGITFDPPAVTMDAGGSGTVKVSAHADDTLEEGPCIMTITATSQGDTTSSGTLQFDVNVTRTSVSGSHNSSTTTWLALTALLLLILLAIVVAVVVLKRRGHEKDEAERPPPNSAKDTGKDTSRAPAHTPPPPESTPPPGSHGVSSGNDLPDPFIDPYAGVRHGSDDHSIPSVVADVEIERSDIFAEKRFHEGYSMAKSKITDITPGQVLDIGDLLQQIHDGGAKPEFIALPPATVIDQKRTDAMNNVEEVFIITNEGLLMSHFAIHSHSSIDKDILASMLTALHSLFTDSFDGIEGTLDEVKYGKFNIIMTPGQMLNVITLVTSEETHELKVTLRKFVSRLEMERGADIANWNGEMKKVEFLSDYIGQLMGKTDELEQWDDPDSLDDGMDTLPLPP